MNTFHPTIVEFIQIAINAIYCGFGLYTFNQNKGTFFSFVFSKDKLFMHPSHKDYLMLNELKYTMKSYFGG